jgi:hypothetical protein
MERGGKRRTGVGGACCSWSGLRPCKMETAAGPLPELSGWSTLHQRMLPKEVLVFVSGFGFWVSHILGNIDSPSNACKPACESIYQCPDSEV